MKRSANALLGVGIFGLWSCLVGAVTLGMPADTTGSPKGQETAGGHATDFIANKIRQLHQTSGDGRVPVSPVLKGKLSTGNRKIFEIRLKAGHCYTIIGVGSPSVRDINISLLAPGGREVQRDTTKNNTPIVKTDPCIRASGQYKILVKMFSGFGQFGLQVFSNNPQPDESRQERN
ncbi:MAG: hypothetical protein QNJ97_18030 [Myxococcota bacterium]|nr:hypothetical protein [Myxococcota bacterium]